MPDQALTARKGGACLRALALIDRSKVLAEAELPNDVKGLVLHAPDKLSAGAASVSLQEGTQSKKRVQFSLH
jgi:hypothetical protein